MHIFFLVISLFLYKYLTYRKINLLKRDTIPRFCIYINSFNYIEILNLLQYQNYPKNLFDVYIKDEISTNYKFKVYKYDKDMIIKSDYDLLTIINDKIDINFLSITSKEYMDGYDIIFSNNIINAKSFLIRKYIYLFLGNKINSNNFSFNFKLYKENILNLNDIFSLQKFLTKKTYLIKQNNDIKSINKIDAIQINTLDKRNIMIKCYFIINLILLLYVTNFLFISSIVFYIITTIYNSYILHKNNISNVIVVVFFPLYLLQYLLFFRLNNKSSNVNTI